MIPMFATVWIRRAGRPGFPLWIPLFLVWVVLLPFALLVVPVLCIVSAIGAVNPFRTLRVFWGILNSVRGTRVEAGNRRHSVLVHIA